MMSLDRSFILISFFLGHCTNYSMYHEIASYWQKASDDFMTTILSTTTGLENLLYPDQNTPHELCNRIIYLAKGDYKTLFICTLICKQWHRVANNIFKTINNMLETHLSKNELMTTEDFIKCLQQTNICKPTFMYKQLKRNFTGLNYIDDMIKNAFQCAVEDKKYYTSAWYTKQNNHKIGLMHFFSHHKNEEIYNLYFYTCYFVRSSSIESMYGVFDKKGKQTFNGLTYILKHIFKQHDSTAEPSKLCVTLDNTWVTERKKGDNCMLVELIGRHALEIDSDQQQIAIMRLGAIETIPLAFLLTFLKKEIESHYEPDNENSHPENSVS